MSHVQIFLPLCGYTILCNKKTTMGKSFLMSQPPSQSSTPPTAVNVILISGKCTDFDFRSAVTCRSSIVIKNFIVNGQPILIFSRARLGES